MGCAAVDALVSSPAGHSAHDASPERMAAIGRVFENQGRYARAESMYRKSLSVDPQNDVAARGIRSIATRTTTRSFESEKPTAATMVAMADSLNGRPTTRRTPQQRAAAVPTPVDVREVIEDQRDQMMASLQPAIPQVIEESQPLPAVLPTVDAGEADNIETTTSDGGDIALANTGWQLDPDAAQVTNTAADVALTFAPAAKVKDISTVGFEGDDTQVATVASMASSWKSANRRISLEQLLDWSDAPAENRDNLLQAVEDGEDDGVKAYAASMLAECPLDDTGIDEPLLEASDSDSDLIRAAIWDVLTQRGNVTEQAAYELLTLTQANDPGIRAQSAASLRHFAGTEWSPASIEGLEELLADSDPSVVAVAAATLGDFGAEAADSRHALMHLMTNTQDDLVRNAADVSLNRIPVRDVSLRAVENQLEVVE